MPVKQTLIFPTRKDYWLFILFYYVVGGILMIPFIYIYSGFMGRSRFWAKYIYIYLYNFFIFLFDRLKINFEYLGSKFFLNLVKINFDMIILIISWLFFKKKKNSNNKPIWSKIGGKNSKPNNKSINLFILNLKKNHLDLNKFEIN